MKDVVLTYFKKTPDKLSFSKIRAGEGEMLVSYWMYFILSEKGYSLKWNSAYVCSEWGDECENSL